jgi:spermidine synthase
VLIIGGGDGLAVREVLRWNPTAVTLIDLDEAMVNLFSGKDHDTPEKISDHLLQLNQHSLLDERVNIIIGDAFLEVEQLVNAGIHYDTIIVDLPDPSHPDLNKLYSSYFYERLKELLSGDGAITIQSTSPYHAQKAFISIGKTLAHAGFMTNQYHTNVPTFGEWGWTIGTLRGKNARARINEKEQLPLADSWISKAQLEAAFVFAPSFYNQLDEIAVNHLGSHLIYNYHHDAWKNEEGIFFIP